jgi:UDP-MurNAc hydroxylase
MRFQILSHAGLLVECGGKTLLFDPWLVGSTYWRSWWNYPPVPGDVVEGLRADFIYLTHIHWDHFQGVTLRRFPRETRILIPFDTNPRLRRDLESMGFKDIRELRHGESAPMGPDFRLTSYHFHPFTDSAAVVEADGTTLFNANDAKFMGEPLRQILARHRRIDFLFRSHSSANPRLCFDYMDGNAGRAAEASDRYLRHFAAFARAVGARYSIPFASNHCFLHKDVFHFNATVTTPDRVESYCRRRGLPGTEVKVMVAGDSWSSDQGFSIRDAGHFIRREERLRRYAEAKAPALAAFYALEARTDVSLSLVASWFGGFSRALPWPVRRLYRRRPLAFSVTGARLRHFVVDLFRGEAREVDALDDARHPLQIHTSTYVFKQCMLRNLFLHLGISKRVLFRCRASDRKWMALFEWLLNMYETGQLPVRTIIGARFLRAWAPRWREILLYAGILGRMAMGRGFEMEDWLPPAPDRSMVVGDLPLDALGAVDLLERQGPRPFVGERHPA